jgi:hypothetical protein
MKIRRNGVLSDQRNDDKRKGEEAAYLVSGTEQDRLHSFGVLDHLVVKRFEGLGRRQFSILQLLEKLDVFLE